VLAGRGEEVVVVRRSQGKVEIPGVETRRGDLGDPAFARSLGLGASVVYQCTNPVYHRWPAELLPNAEGSITVARESGARLVVLDNVYAYGDTGGVPRSETTPLRPVSKKGALRKKMAERYLEAAGEGLGISLVRASDFVGPGFDQSILGDRAVKSLRSGGSAQVLGDPEQPHAYTFGLDVAEALIRTGALQAPPFVVHVPTLPALPTRVWVEAIARALGTKPKMLRAPRWVLSAMGFFDPVVAELVEMLYQFEAPFLYDDAASRALLSMEPTPFERQIAVITEHAPAAKAA